MAARTRRIMVGYDGSEPARRALAAAGELVGYGSTLAVVALRNGNGDVREDARARLLSRQVPATYLSRGGEPGESLVEAARELDVDLLVVGDDEALRAAAVAQAPCDVLVVR
jgi:nucleotide-binding universal stress UspA family protein